MEKSPPCFFLGQIGKAPAAPKKKIVGPPGCSRTPPPWAKATRTPPSLGANHFFLGPPPLAPPPPFRSRVRTLGRPNRGPNQKTQPFGGFSPQTKVHGAQPEGIQNPNPVWGNGSATRAPPLQKQPVGGVVKAAAVPPPPTPQVPPNRCFPCAHSPLVATQNKIFFSSQQSLLFSCFLSPPEPPPPPHHTFSPPPPPRFFLRAPP